MKNFLGLSNEEKRKILNELTDKKVAIKYTESDLPNGKIGPTKIIGEITTVELTSFDFKFETSSEIATLTIDGIEVIQVLK